MNISGDADSNYIIGSSEADLIEGLGGNDYMSGLGGGDVMYGDAGNDTLKGGAGDDDIYGGTGLDWALYDGNMNEYSVGIVTNVVSVYDLVFDGGIDYVMDDVERIQFDDMGIAYDLYGNAGAAARMVGTLFGPAAVDNPYYMQIFIEAFDDGYSAHYIAEVAIDIVYPTYSNQDIAELVYFNLAGYPGSDAEIFWLTDLVNTYGDAWVVVEAGYTSYNEASIDFAGLVETGVEFLPFG
ncbi:MAG: hypothetical protein V4684_18505 [Pseudomonadota bacterium]